MKPTRQDILSLLRCKRNIVSDRNLVFVITDYLSRNFDIEIVEATEKSFGEPLTKLKIVAQRATFAEFSDAWPGTCPWLKEYLKFTEKNEAPSIFHAMSALTLVSMIMGRRFWVDMGYFKVFPPMATILVGPSGLRKTTAIDIAWKTLESIYPYKVIREKITPETIIAAAKPDDPNGDAICLLIAPEMSTSFGKVKYMQGMVPTLTRLLDHDVYAEHTRGRGKEVLERVGFGILAGTTTSWMIEEMSTSVVSGGFTARLLIPYVKSTARVFMRQTQVDRALQTQLALVLQELLDQGGPIGLSKAADHILTEWYTIHRGQNNVDDLMSGYHNRKLTHIIRLAMIFTVLEGLREIDRHQLFEAAELLKFIEPGMLELFEELGRPQNALDADLIINYLLVNNKKVLRPVLLKDMSRKVPIGRLREAVEFMIEADIIKQITHKSGVLELVLNETKTR